MPSSINTAVPPCTFDIGEPDLLTVKKDDRTREYTDFLKYVAQSSGAISYEQLAILYPSICQASLEWLLREKKSVDFGFIILHPMPHRANWKQILLALYPGLGPSLLGKSRTIKQAIMTGLGFFTKMLSGELLAVARERYVVWGIETELKRSWWRAMMRHESYKFVQLGSVDYASSTARSIVKLRPKLVNAYLSFLRQISYPCARIQQSRTYRRGFITPFVPKGKVRPVPDENRSVDIVVPRDPQELATPSLNDLVQEDAGLPPVRDFRPEPQDLRVTLGKQPS